MKTLARLMRGRSFLWIHLCDSCCNNDLLYTCNVERGENGRWGRGRGDIEVTQVGVGGFGVETVQCDNGQFSIISFTLIRC